MKRSILISFLIVVALMASSILAQDTAPRAMKYGIKAGVGLANITGDETDLIIETETDTLTIEPSAKLGINFGLWLQYMMTPQIAIQPEVLYVSKGTKYEEGSDKITYKINYIEIPVLFKYMIPTNGKIAPNFFAGPYVAFKASAKAKAEFGGVEDEADLEDVKSTDFGVTFGGGLDFAAGGTGVVPFVARYTLGLSNVVDTDVEDVSVKTNNIAFFVGYGF